MSKGLIIFDFDGTLGDTRRNIVATMQMTINELQLPYRSEDECASTIGLPLVPPSSLTEWRRFLK